MNQSCEICYCCLCEQLKKLKHCIKKIVPTTINVNSTTTLPAGSSAIVTNSGTPTKVLLNFGIPTGKEGNSPFIGTNGNWWVGSTDTTVKAQGEQGIPGPAGTSATLISSHIRGALLNDTGNPQIVASGNRIDLKELRGNSTGLITLGPLNAYFSINQIGTYLCIMNLCAATTKDTDNTVVNWGIYAKQANTMLTSASNFLTQSLQGITNVCIFSVKDLTEQYTLINNSKISIRVQGAQATQVVYNTMQSSNSLIETDGMGISFIKLS